MVANGFSWQGQRNGRVSRFHQKRCFLLFSLRLRGRRIGEQAMSKLESDNSAFVAALRSGT